MVLKMVYAAGQAILPTQYIVHITLAIAFLVVVRAFAQGRTTTRERDLHARVILVTVR
jgi:hypothetical protein